MRRALLIFKSLCILTLLAGCVPVPAAAPTPVSSSAQRSLPAEVTAIMTASPPRIYATYPSPNNQWRIEIVIHDCVRTGDDQEAKAYEALKLIRSRDGTEMAVQDQLRYCGGLGAFGLDGLRWSADSRYFFFTDAREGQPDGAPPGTETWKPPVYRLDAAQGRVERFE